jgi:hypothetical protein
MNELKFELSVEEANTILRVLGKHPFDEVVTLIQKIKSQGEVQVAELAKQAEAAPAKAAPPAPAKAAP